MPRRITMHAQPQRTLKRLIRQYGQELIDDPRRTEALLRDLCGQHTREIFVIVNAQRLHVPSELRAAPPWLPYAAIQSRLTRQLQTKLALTQDAADWAVDTWAAALDVTPDNGIPSLPWGWGDLVKRPSRESAGRSKGQKAKSGVQSGKGTTDKARRRSPRVALAWRLAALPWRGVQIPWRWSLARGQVLSVGAVAVAVIVIAVLVLTSRDSPSPVGPETSTPISATGAGVREDSVPVVTMDELSLSPPGVYLRESWTLPHYAKVTADGLFVREGPSVDYQDIAILQARHTVRVIGFSDDGLWSQIDQPRWGWVSNDFLEFESSADGSVRLQVRVIQAKSYAASVRQGPRGSSAEIGSISAGSTAVAVAVTNDDGGDWLQIVEPAIGWVANNDVVILGSP